MPVRELIRGLVGAAVALLVTVILLLCLSEVRNSERGVWWYTGKWSRTAYFSPIWQPLIVFGAMNMIFGWVLAGKLNTRWNAFFALAGAAQAVVLCELVIPVPAHHLSGQAGQNTRWLLDLFVAFAGAWAGAAIAGKLGSENRRKKRTRPGIRK